VEKKIPAESTGTYSSMRVQKDLVDPFDGRTFIDNIG
jgi:hypothetical protein